MNGETVLIDRLPAFHKDISPNFNLKTYLTFGGPTTVGAGGPLIPYLVVFCLEKKLCNMAFVIGLTAAVLDYATSTTTTGFC